MNRKGQINTIDFLIAMFFFAAIIYFVISFTAVQQENNLVKLHQDVLLTAGTTVTDMLAESSGTPANWEMKNISDIQAVGLAASPNKLSALKVGRFTAMDYNTSKTVMGLPASTDYYFAIVDTGGAVLQQSGTDPPDPTMSFLFTRYVIWNGSAAWMRLKIYE
jgi:hypothetical protein